MKNTLRGNASLVVFCLIATLLLLCGTPAARAQSAPSVALHLTAAGDTINKTAILQCGHAEDPDADILYKFNRVTFKYTGNAYFWGLTINTAVPFTVTASCTLGGTNIENALVNVINSRWVVDHLGIGCSWSFDGTLSAVVNVTKKQYKNGIWTTTSGSLPSNLVTLHLDPAFGVGAGTYCDPYIHAEYSGQGSGPF